MEEGKRLTEITRENFVLKGELRDYLEKVRKMLVDGRGFGLWKGLPVDEWGVEKAAVAYMGIGTYLGFVLPGPPPIQSSFSPLPPESKSKILMAFFFGI